VHTTIITTGHSHIAMLVYLYMSVCVGSLQMPNSTHMSAPTPSIQRKLAHLYWMCVCVCVCGKCCNCNRFCICL